MKISIVTPTYNRTTFLNETIESIVTQEGDFELEYIIQDGGSDQELLAILEQWDQKIKNKEVEIKCKKLTFQYFIEQDNGMYDAINKGFAKSTGDIMAWLNSDDVYHPSALQSVNQIFNEFDTVDWLTGIPNAINTFSSCVRYDDFPVAYSQEYIERGYYRIENIDCGFQWIQQDSTFWRRSLWEKIGAKLQNKYKYAADFYLWKSFAKYTDLVKARCFLGTYRIHEDQFTATPEIYTAEILTTNYPQKNFKKLYWIISNIPKTRRLFFNKYEGTPFLNILKLKSKTLKGRVVEWSFAQNTWVIFKKSIL